MSSFALDPVIKSEFVWAGPIPRPAAMLVERRGALVRSRQDQGEWETVHDRLLNFDSMLLHVADSRRTPELLALREEIRSWRFYDHYARMVRRPRACRRLVCIRPFWGTMARTWLPRCKPSGKSATRVPWTARLTTHFQALPLR